MNESLHNIGLKHKTDKATLHNYLQFYEKHLPDRSFNGRLIEFGIWTGSSIRMWREYFPNAEIVGVDVKLRCEPMEGVTLIEASSTDIAELQKLGSFDIIIEDASHDTLDQQINFFWMYNHQLNPGGLYIMEDLHTSFMKEHINSKQTTYDLLHPWPNAIEHYGRNGASISIIIPK
jgi:trans-aconitate methyltransferase